jgi:hypothetical protein
VGGGIELQVPQQREHGRDVRSKYDAPRKNVRVAGFDHRRSGSDRHT